MSWKSRYLEQEQAWLKEAHAWATHGKDDHAQRCRDNAAVYKVLAEEESEDPLITREEAQAMEPLEEESPFEKPKIMDGYPMSDEEKAACKRVTDGL